MAIKNVNGHGTTSILGASGGQEAQKGQPAFSDTKGPAAYQGTAPKGGGFKMSGGGSKKKSVPSNATPTVKIGG